MECCSVILVAHPAPVHPDWVCSCTQGHAAARRPVLAKFRNNLTKMYYPGVCICLALADMIATTKEPRLALLVVTRVTGKVTGVTGKVTPRVIITLWQEQLSNDVE